MGDSLWDLVGCVREKKPNCTTAAAKQFLNKRLRHCVEHYRWSDLIRIGSVIIPDAYATGTISATAGSPNISGSGTAWPVNDLVSTTLAANIQDSGYVDIQPSAMTNIQQGMYVVIELENSSITEIVPVVRVEANKFKAYCRQQHASGATVVASSLSNLQLYLNDYVFTVTAVLSATSLRMDMAWGGQAVTGNPYQIYLGYAQISPTARRLKFAYDGLQGRPLDIDKTWDYANRFDPQRTNTGDPMALLMMPPHPAGVTQWEIYPRQSSARRLNVVYDDGWPLLVDDTDLSPHFLNPEVLIAGAQADALMTRVIARDGETDPYYDIQAGQILEAQYREYLDGAVQSDQGRYLTLLSNWIEQVQGLGAVSADMARGNPLWTSEDVFR